MTRYNKPALTFSQQVDLLVARGLVVKNKKRVERTLANISYYRLSAYMLPFKVCQNGVVIDQFTKVQLGK